MSDKVKKLTQKLNSTEMNWFPVSLQMLELCENSVTDVRYFCPKEGAVGFNYYVGKFWFFVYLF